jgi:hypothetical protein
MRELGLAIWCFLVLSLGSCASSDEERRAAIEAGGSLPWNRPASWEGQTPMGMQLQGTP